VSFQKPDSKPNLFNLEAEIAKFWKQNNTFLKSVEQRKGATPYRFYDGPPFISGTPHYGHIKDFVVKDLVPRYWTMKGYYAPRFWGWDCHGLPIENKVEKKLGIKSKLQVEELGLKKYIAECYDYTRSTSEEWLWYIEKIGRWIDYDHAYRTMDQDYMESVWWVFKNLNSKDLIYKGMRSSLYSTDSATPVSSFEIAMDNTYEDVEDTAITVKFKLRKDEKFAEIFKSYSTQIGTKDVYALSWTTTPWTLASNFALALNPDEEYALIKTSQNNAELTGKWLVNELPFDYDKKDKAKIEEYFLSYAGEEVDSLEIANHTASHSSDLKKAEISIRKVGKKFYYVENNLEHEIKQQDYQKLSREAKSQFLVKTRIYYPFGAESKETVLSKKTIKDQLIAYLDIYESTLAGLQIAEVNFYSPVEYQSFISHLPAWFGKELTQGLDLAKVIATNNLTEVQAYTDKLVPSKKFIIEDYQQYLILALKLAEQNLRGEYHILGTFKGQEITGLAYEQIYNYLEAGENDLKIYASEYVTVTDGTGVLHVAPAFGEEDFEIGKKYNLSFKQCIDDAGNMLAGMGQFSGKYLRNVAQEVVNELSSRNLLFKSEKYVHRLPFYRYENPLIYRAQESWFINVQKLKPQLLAQNENINWVPEHLKHGRFAKGIETAPDWSISRSRFWSTSMPVWVEKDNISNKPQQNFSISDSLIVGSRSELRLLAKDPITRLNFLTIPFKSLANLNEESVQGLSQLILGNEFLKQEYADHQGIYIPQLAGTKELAKELSLELERQGIKGLEVNELPGIAEISLELIKVLDNAKERFNLRNISELTKLDLESVLAEVKAKFTDIFAQLLTKITGQHSTIIIPEELLALIKNIYEGKSEVESFSSLNQTISLYSMYFVGTKLLDLHRPAIDEIVLIHPTSHKEFVRIPEVLDVWLDSGSMPFAQIHYPFANKDNLESGYPADFIVEYIAQTRAWFYVTHVLGVALSGQNAFKNVITTGVIFGNDGRKMSKTYGNYPDPRITLENYGAEALRWYLLNSKILVGEDMNFEEKALRDQLRLYILPVWNIYSFLTTYANLHNWQPSPELLNNKLANKSGSELSETYWYKIPFVNRANKLDAWIITILQKLIHEVRAELDSYNIPTAVRLIQDFSDKLSKIYIRSSRDRFNSADPEAFETLYYVLVEFLKVTAPFTPFLTEHIYQELVGKVIEGQITSIHLTDYPEADMDYLEKHAKLLSQMEIVQEIIALGQSIRTQNRLKIRQTLQALEVVLVVEPERDQKLEVWMKDMIARELNLLEVREHSKVRTYDGGLTQTNTTGNISVTIDTNLNAELVRLGKIREFSRVVQQKRKELNLNIGDKIELQVLTSDKDLKQLLEENKIEVASQTGSDKINISEPAKDILNSQMIEVDINGVKCYLQITTK